MKYIFCDENLSVVTEFQRILSKEKNIIIYHGPFTDFLSYNPENLAIICPIDSFGTCSSGFSKAVTQTFSEFTPQIQDFIINHGDISNRSRNFLEIGCAVSILVDNTHIIAVPTMYTDQNVDSTNNAFYAFLAARHVIEKINRKFPDSIQTIISPGLCTGVGNMTSKKAVEQITEALNTSLKNHNDGSKLPYFYYNTDSFNNLQPLTHQNKEFIIFDKDIFITKKHKLRKKFKD